MKTNKKGFTLIELLTVIAILGILVLLAAPKFLGYAERANIAKIQTGIKSVETVLDLNTLDNPELTKDWVVLTPEQLQEINDSGKLIDRNGFIKEDLDGGKYIPLKDLDSVKWNSGGEFILAKDEESVYYYNKDLNISKAPDGSATIPGDGGNEDPTPPTGPTVPEESETPAEPETPEITYPIIHDNGDEEYEDGTILKPDGNLLNPDGSITLPDGNLIPVATDVDFTWTDDPEGYTVQGKGVGYYKYTGSKTSVVIPEKIADHKLTSYYRMFYQSPVIKVISYNTGINSTRLMFEYSQGENLDLSKLNVEDVSDFHGMFKQSSLKSLDISNFNTSNAVDMSYMFHYSRADALNIAHLDTSNVTDMSMMFAYVRKANIDFSTFDTSKVTNMYGLFHNAQAISINLRGIETQNVTNMSYMFFNSYATVSNLTALNTSKVTNMQYMFSSYYGGVVDLRNFNTSNVINMTGMFSSYKGTSLDLSSFDVSKVDFMSSMFEGVSFANVPVRTQADAKKFSESHFKPVNLTFTVK